MAKQGNKTEKQICTDLNSHMLMFQIGSAIKFSKYLEVFLHLDWWSKVFLKHRN